MNLGRLQAASANGARKAIAVPKIDGLALCVPGAGGQNPDHFEHAVNFLTQGNNNLYLGPLYPENARILVREFRQKIKRFEQQHKKTPGLITNVTYPKFGTVAEDAEILLGCYKFVRKLTGQPPMVVAESKGTLAFRLSLKSVAADKAPSTAILLVPPSRGIPYWLDGYIELYRMKKRLNAPVSKAQYELNEDIARALKSINDSAAHLSDPKNLENERSILRSCTVIGGEGHYLFEDILRYPLLFSKGDGTVPSWSVPLPHANNYFVNALHSDVKSHPAVLAKIAQIFTGESVAPHLSPYLREESKAQQEGPLSVETPRHKFELYKVAAQMSACVIAALAFTHVYAGFPGEEIMNGLIRFDSAA